MRAPRATDMLRGDAWDSPGVSILSFPRPFADCAPPDILTTRLKFAEYHPMGDSGAWAADVHSPARGALV